uniref:Uncharacterized protein n=1 Tax=Schistosoma curassoni TaxID=6186 RepID=A0A183KIE0_9TREM
MDLSFQMERSGRMFRFVSIIETFVELLYGSSS